MPGAHNALNAAAALEVASLAGADPERAIAGLAGFTGAGRRFQRLGATAGGAVVYDDYAHHPTEVAATLKAARTFEPRRLVAVFQPHLYSRTALLAWEFGRGAGARRCGGGARRLPRARACGGPPGRERAAIALATADAARGRPVYWLPTFADARRSCSGLLGEGDLCLVMGAGDVDALGRRLVGAGDVEAPGRGLVEGAGDVEAPERGLVGAADDVEAPGRSVAEGRAGP